MLGDAISDPSTPRLLADIGGTNARFALLVDGEIRASKVLACTEYPDFSLAVDAYLDTQAKQYSRPIEAAFAVAAPIVADHIAMTNHTWSFSVAALRARLELRRLIVLNDFTALAMAVPHLPTRELEKIGGGQAINQRPIALLGPGTGLGVSGLIPADSRWIPIQGEGGHVTMGASDIKEAAVLEVLRARFAHISAERVISGPGLFLLYEALCTVEGVAPQVLQPARVAELGLTNANTQCRAALEMFCAMLGTVAGNLALTLGAHGGVYIGGGIVPRFGNFFAASSFRQRFEAKGRYANYLAAVPVFVIHSALPAFIGLARTFSDPGPRIQAIA
ncbi:MAG: glucokinase [Candidatus Obscuribacterales bacterium]|nr:glucokinase [Steroidobacteraceae bacterium]